MVRTTIDIPDPTYRRLKAKAAAEGRSVKSLLLEAADAALASATKTPAERVTLPLVAAKRPGRLALTNGRIYDVISFP